MTMRPRRWATQIPAPTAATMRRSRRMARLCDAGALMPVHSTRGGGAGAVLDCTANGLFVQDDGEQRVVDLEAALVGDEPEPLEFLHEEVDPRSRRPDHFRQRLLRNR